MRCKGVVAVFLCWGVAVSPAFGAPVSLNSGAASAGAPVVAPVPLPQGEISPPLASPDWAPGPAAFSALPALPGVGAPSAMPAFAAAVSLAPTPVSIQSLDSIPALRPEPIPASGREEAPDPREALGASLTRMSDSVAAQTEAGREGGSAGAWTSAARQFGVLTGETLRAGSDASADGTAASADGQPFLLHLPALAPGEAQRLRALNVRVEETAREALRPHFPSGRFSVQSRGSTARLTHVGPGADFDVTVAVPGGWDRQALLRFLARKGEIKTLRPSLERAFSRLAEELFPDRRAEVRVSSRKRISQPVVSEAGNVFHEEDGSAYLLTVTARDEDSRERLLKVDLLFSNNSAYLNEYPAHFARQMAQIEHRGGEAAVKRALAEIPLAKALFQRVIRIYKPYHGGPSGVGVEQMVLQSGGFERMLLNALRAAYDSSGRLRGPKAAARQWTVANHFLGPENFLQFLSAEAWEKLAFAARRYFELRALGRPFSLAALSPGRSDPSGRLPAALRRLLKSDPGPVAPAQAAPASALAAFPSGNSVEVGKETLELLDRFTASGPTPARRGRGFLLAQGAQALPPGLTPPAETQVFPGDPARAGESLRGILVRNDQGVALRPLEERAKPVPLPEDLGRGTVAGTLVQIDFGEEETTVRRIGARPQDMVVGRLRRTAGGMAVEPLLSERGIPLTLYGSLPVGRSEVPLTEGRIVQAFVHQEGGRGPESAVPLEDLGETLTPEIAAREIALRRGARGYMPREVIEQAEARTRASDPEAEFRRLSSGSRDKDVPAPEDLRPAGVFITKDPPGAGDLDDADDIRKRPDGSWSWTLATALIGSYVPPGTPAFREAARAGNTFYSIDKDGVPEYPMNHPAISKYAASLLPGKDNLALITSMRLSSEGSLLQKESRVGLGIVRVDGRYTYEQVRDYWKGLKDHGLRHTAHVDLTRELAALLRGADLARGKLDFDFAKPDYRKTNGEWGVVVEERDPLLAEAHSLVEELKVSGNRVIAPLLEHISRRFGIPHLSRIHPPQDEKKNAQLRRQLQKMGLPWPKDEPLADYLERLRGTRGLDERRRQTAMLTALRTRTRAVYGIYDDRGHEGLALRPGQYDHPSAGIRRFADMYNLTLLDAYLRGGSVRRAYAAMMEDLRALGFEDLAEFAIHLNERARAADEMEREVERFMTVHELSKPRNQGRKIPGYVKSAALWGPPRALIQLEDPFVILAVEGPPARTLALARKVQVTVEGTDLPNMSVRFRLGR